MEQSRDYLLQSIYDTDSVSQEILSRPISSHIETATPLSQVQYRLSVNKCLSSHLNISMDVSLENLVFSPEN
jgi:hypothetical protein